MPRWRSTFCSCKITSIQCLSCRLMSTSMRTWKQLLSSVQVYFFKERKKINCYDLLTLTVCRCRSRRLNRTSGGALSRQSRQGVEDLCLADVEWGSRRAVPTLIATSPTASFFTAGTHGRTLLRRPHRHRSHWFRHSLYPTHGLDRVQWAIQ